MQQQSDWCGSSPVLRRKLSLSRNLPCSTCNGSGTKSGKKYECGVSGEAHLLVALLLCTRMHMLQGRRWCAHHEPDGAAAGSVVLCHAHSPCRHRLDSSGGFYVLMLCTIRLFCLLQTCRGTGVQVHIRPLGPGMVQQIQSRCSTCSGSGFSTPGEHAQHGPAPVSFTSPACCAGTGEPVLLSVWELHAMPVRN